MGIDYRKTHTRVLTAAPFTVAKNKTEIAQISINSKLWNSHIMASSEPSELNKLLLHTTWMNLTNTRQSERNQTHNSRLYIISHVLSSEIGTLPLCCWGQRRGREGDFCRGSRSASWSRSWLDGWVALWQFMELNTWFLHFPVLYYTSMRSFKIFLIISSGKFPEWIFSVKAIYEFLASHTIVGWIEFGPTKMLTS